jgi:hypothetical protein
MMVATKPKIDRPLRWLAFLAGLALAVVLVLGWRVDPGASELGLELRVIVNSTGELAVSPAGEIAVGRQLQPRTDRDRIEAKASIRNQTAQDRRVNVRGLPSSRDLDDLLLVTVRAGGRQLFRGPLGELRRPTRRSLRLESGRSARLTVSARLPEDVRSGYQARIEDLTLELRTEAG